MLDFLKSYADLLRHVSQHAESLRCAACRHCGSWRALPTLKLVTARAVWIFCVAVEELKLSYNISKTALFAICPYYVT